ncbi:MAG: outer membrane protein, OmpW-related [Actinobacteria bacterium]|nr:outer membrane protein, OmpW-related [Actinomycetota bacterium]
MKKTGMFSLFITMVLFLLSMTTAYAKPLAANYAQLKIGGFFPQTNDLDHFDAGGNFEVGIGHRVAPGFAIEGNFGYFETKGTFNLPGIGSVDETFKVMPLTLSFKGQTFFDRFEPYAEAGIGVYFIKDELNGTVLGFSGSDSENDTQLGLHVGLGGNYNITPQVFLGVEGRYLWLRTDTFGVNVQLDGFLLTANLGYRF